MFDCYVGGPVGTGIFFVILFWAVSSVSATWVSSMHRSHFGSRYKLGCCGHAGLFAGLAFIVWWSLMPDQSRRQLPNARGALCE